MRAVPLQRAVAATVSRERLAAPQSAVDAVLTEREREVLALVAEGLTNREIGSRLFISAKTASVHLSNLMAKLNVSSRTEAVTVAQRRGLLDVRLTRPARSASGPDWANASCAGPVLRPRVEDVPIRTLRRRQEETTCTRQARASDSRARCQGRFSTAATRLPPPRQPGSTRRSPTRPSVVVAAESADDVAAAVRYAAEVGSRVAVQATGHGAAHAVDGAVLVTTARMQGCGSTRSPGARGSRPGSAGGP